MNRLVLSLALSGCTVLSPVVGGGTNDPGGASESCDPDVLCSRLEEPPPPTLGEDDLPDTFASGCDAFTPMAMTIAEDTTLDGATLGCVDLRVTVSDGSDPVALRIGGESLTGAIVRVTSTSRVATVVLAPGFADHVEVHLVGAVRLSVDGTSVGHMLLSLEGDEPIDPPEALFANAVVDRVRIVGPRASARFRDARVARVDLDLRSIAFERGTLSTAALRGDLVELLDVIVRSARFDAMRMIVTGGQMAASEFARCDSLTLAGAQVRGTRFAACTDPIDAQTSSFGDCTFAGSIAGARALITRGVIGGSSVAIEAGILENVALCGTEQLAATQIECVRCAPSSPTDVCVDSLTSVDACPGICAAECSRGLSPMQVAAQICAE